MAIENGKALRKGDMTRERILDRAADMASIYGLDDLTIGSLAAELGMSKSGLYAHFGSKEELQLATIDAAEALFDDAVVGPMDAADPGLPAVLALVDAFLDHLRRRVFPGGCFFACASAELQSRPGPVKERIVAFDGRWRRRFDEHLRIAQSAGDIRSDEDLDQLFFELDAYLLYAHAAFAFRGDPNVLERAADAVRHRVA
jgi:AcrR family transcriptional regulator